MNQSGSNRPQENHTASVAAVSRPQPVANERVAKCLFVSHVALQTVETARAAIYECEEAIDRVQAAANAASRAADGLRKAREKLLDSIRDLNAVAGAWLERAVKP